MWTIIELISKNPEISLSSRHNPEMSQRSKNIFYSIDYKAFHYVRNF